MSDSSQAPKADKPSAESTTNSLRDNAAWLVALLGSLVAAVVPVTEAVRGHYEMKMKDTEFEHEMELKTQDLQSRIEIQFLTLATASTVQKEDKRRILDILANYSSAQTPLQLWAKNERSALSSDITEITKLSDASYAALNEKNPSRRAWLIADNRLAWALHDQEVASIAEDREVVEKLARDTIPQLRQAADAAQLLVVAELQGSEVVQLTVPALKLGETLQGKVTQVVVSQMFPNTPLENINSHLPEVLQSLSDAGIGNTEMALVALSLIRAEVETFDPVSELISRFNTSPGGHPFDLYDNRTDLGNLGPPDGAQFKGRGYVQLTGRTIYTLASHQLGWNGLLVNEPDKANDPLIAARTIAWFLKTKEDAIHAAIKANDLALARRLTNGGSSGLDRFAAAFRIGQKLLE